MIMYTAAMDTSLGALLAQHNDQRKENALYYLSRTLVGAELRYMTMEKTKIKKGWDMHFDGASRSPDSKKQNDPKNNQSSIGIVFVRPEGGIILHSFSLMEGCSNNEVEYEAIITELKLSLEVSIDDLTIYGDSELLIKQLKGEYQIRKPNLLPYYERANYILANFPKL
ncbi:hypothetical protein RJ639_033318 [Escallonia herrerae]|uniref:RNase H type-1 domain-containing protein n=1 Tax=Escallonia herrerae TaxID=1293975 RepID=A0AA88WVI6_9ASTE|nr:hypothetical protein RJ639_033318 [Escallonia herrerae]